MSYSVELKNLEEWYKVSTRDVKRLGGSGLLKQYKSMYTLLKTLYPEYPLTEAAESSWPSSK